MRLSKVILNYYRSVASKLVVHIRPELTCLIGANEHGKSNILQAIPLLRDGRFGSYDCNTDAPDNNAFPELQFELLLNATDRRHLQDAIQYDIAALEEIERDDDENKIYGILKRLKTYYSNDSSNLEILVTSTGNRRILFGSEGWLLVTPEPANASNISKWFRRELPDIVLFESSHELADEVSLTDLKERNNFPFEGILKLAGLWNELVSIFEGDLKAHRLLDEGGRRLTRRIRKIWSQGSRLEFQFHYSGANLALRIKDPVTFDTPSLRSLGFRSFLSFYLTLYSETQELDPEGFILLFDEPGLHLHPQGQKDLLRELRKLSQKNQIIYATHSPFLIDRNDLSSLLLVRKGTKRDDQGTRVVYKPHGDNWRPLTAALGIVPADAFFPPEISLVVEGNSDRIYITTYMRLLADSIKADLNYLSIIDADRREELPAVVSMLLGSDRTVVVLADGDKGGTNFEKFLRRRVGSRKSSMKFIDLREISCSSKEVSIEDLLPKEAWFRALQQYVRDILGCEHKIDAVTIENYAKTLTLAKATAKYLKEIEILENESNFSKTSVAHLFSVQELSAPESETAIYKLCAEITKQLRIGR